MNESYLNYDEMTDEDFATLPKRALIEDIMIVKYLTVSDLPDGWKKQELLPIVKNAVYISTPMFGSLTPQGIRYIG